MPLQKVTVVLVKRNAEAFDRISLYKVTHIRRDAAAIAETLKKCCGEIYELFGNFHDFRHFERLKPHIDRITQLYRDAEKCFIRAASRLCAEATSPLQITVWLDILDGLRDCCSECRSVARIVDAAVLRNT